MESLTMNPIRRSARRGRSVTWGATIAAALMTSVRAANGPPPDHADTWCSALTTIEAGNTAVLPVATGTEARDRSISVATSDPRVVTVVALPGTSAPAARVLQGHNVGFVRIRAGAPGEADLRLDNGASIRVRVTEPRTPINRSEPRLISPAPAAHVWGRVSVGAEHGEIRSDADGRVELRVRDPLHSTREDRLTPESVSPRSTGLPIRSVFSLDADTWPTAESLDLTPILICESRAEFGRTIRVRLTRPSAGDAVDVEAESEIAVTRPERFADARRPIGSDPNASGGAFFDNAGSTPALCVPVEVARPGWYQIIVRASGTLAGGALPTVGIVIDGAPYPSTNGNLVSEAWHRVALGVPVRLEAGTRVVTPYFENDFYVQGRADRNLRLDRVEIARVGDAQPDAALELAGPPTGAAPMMAMSGMSAATAQPENDPTVELALPVRVAWDTALEGEEIPGDIEISGRTWWDESVQRRAPLVTLKVNGREYGTQRAAHPRFWLNTDHLGPGANQLQLEARLDCGTRVSAPAQTVVRAARATDRLLLNPPSSPAVAIRADFARFTVHDERWDAAVSRAWTTQDYPEERFAAAILSNTRLSLTLPEDLEGEFEILVEAKGQEFRGPPIVAASLQTGELDEFVGEIGVPTWWSTQRAGVASLRSGPKTLWLSFTNDLYEQGKGDRNIWLQSVSLRRVIDRSGDAPARVEVIWPPPDERFGLAGSVVARVVGSGELDRAELLIDGTPSGLEARLSGRAGNVVLPFVGRGLTRGPVALSVAVRDVSGRRTESAAVRIAFDPSASGTTYDRAVRLLDRFAFGPDPRSLAAVLTRGEATWLAAALGHDPDAGDRAAFGLGAARFPSERSDYDVPRRVLSEVIATPNPARARAVLWIENHFSTWIRKSEAERQWSQHVAYWQLGPGVFRELLFASAQSPAMLRYLDQERSFAGTLNENYAREVMELHTLGVRAGYQQADVTALAHVLAGWTVAVRGDGAGGGPGAGQSVARFDPALNDGRAQRVFGLDLPDAAPADRAERTLVALEMLAGHPTTAQFISRKLVEHYAAAPAPDELVNDVARVFSESGGDLGATLIGLARHGAFWDEQTAPPRVAHTLDFAARFARLTGMFNPWFVGDFLQRSGAGLMDRATPDGYPEADARYTDSNALLQRWKLAEACGWAIDSLVADSVRHAVNTRQDHAAEERLIDSVAIRLTGRLLSRRSHEAALAHARALQSDSGNRARELAVFVAQLPETSLR
ncbi:MAG: DUF1800 family protein [Phycisphaerae bacterium]|nr:DUF1800 family protein [Phycisphaerae bacterium]